MSLSHIRLPPCCRLPAGRGGCVSTCVHACVRSSPDYRESELKHVAQLACVRALSEINESDRIRRILRMDE